MIWQLRVRGQKNIWPIWERLSILREHKLHLNASKCSFGVNLGKFLGYTITHCEIKVNPEQIRAINSLHSPRNPKEMQRLTGMTAALNRFISRSTDKCHPFFQLLHKWKDFQWTEECVTAFEECCIHTQQSPKMMLVSSQSGTMMEFRGPSTTLANPYRRLRHAIYPWKRQCQPLCMPLGNFLITSMPIPLWCLPSSLYKPY